MNRKAKLRKVKLQILVGTTNPAWQDCQQLNVWVHASGYWSTPLYDSQEEAFKAVVDSKDTLLNDCLVAGLLRVVEFAS